MNRHLPAESNVALEPSRVDETGPSTLERVQSLVRDLFALHGRSNRLTLIVANLVVLLLLTLWMICMSMVFQVLPPGGMSNGAIAILVIAVLSVGIPLGWFSLAQHVRRVHDLGVSGRWSLAAMGLALVVGGVATLLFDPRVGVRCFVGIDLAWSACLYALPGGAQLNRFGPPPMRGVWILNVRRGSSPNTPERAAVL